MECLPSSAGDPRSVGGPRPRRNPELEEEAPNDAAGEKAPAGQQCRRLPETPSYCTQLCKRLRLHRNTPSAPHRGFCSTSTVLFLELSAASPAVLTASGGAARGCRRCIEAPAAQVEGLCNAWVRTRQDPLSQP